MKIQDFDLIWFDLQGIQRCNNRKTQTQKHTHKNMKQKNTIIYEDTKLHIKDYKK